MGHSIQLAICGLQPPDRDGLILVTGPREDDS